MNTLPTSCYWLQIKVFLSMTDPDGFAQVYRDQWDLSIKDLAGKCPVLSSVNSKEILAVEFVCNASHILANLDTSVPYIDSIEILHYLYDPKASIIEDLPAPIFNDLADELFNILSIHHLASKTTINRLKEWA